MNQGNTRVMVGNHIQRGSGNSNFSPGFGDFGGKRMVGSCSSFPLHQSRYFLWPFFVVTVTLNFAVLCGKSYQYFVLVTSLVQYRHLV